MRSIVAVQGLQFGSEAKGNVSMAVALQWEPDTVVAAWGPNAGHTAWLGDLKYVHTMLPMGALAPAVQNILLGPGSVINVESLRQELTQACANDRRILEGKYLCIHPQASILRPEHSYREQSLVSIGSTMKGTAEAVMEKMRRSTDPTGLITARQHAKRVMEALGEVCAAAGVSISISSKIYDGIINTSSKMLIEGAQGFSLGMHQDFYPYTTSRDVSTAQLLADCRIPFPSRPNIIFHVIGVMRTYPIRVANRYKEVRTPSKLVDIPDEVSLECVGTSGGYYYDQEEIEWSDIQRPAELTTVTKLPRRLFTFSDKQIHDAIRIMGVTQLCLTFADYLQPPADPPEVVMSPALRHIINRFDGGAMGPHVKTVSFGPRTSDIFAVTDGMSGSTEFRGHAFKWVL